MKLSDNDYFKYQVNDIARHFKEYKWAIDPSYLINEFIKNTFNEDYLTTFINELKKYNIKNVKLVNDEGKLLFKSSSYKPKIYYNKITDKIEIFSYSIKFRVDKKNLIYLGVL